MHNILLLAMQISTLYDRCWFYILSGKAMSRIAKPTSNYFGSSHY